MVEVKADALEESFDAFEEEDGVAALKAELELLKAKVASGAIAAQRPALDGVKSAEASSFVDQYLRRGIEAGLETKAIGSSSDAIGGYAVPEEIDRVIDETLTAISPIRAIANVVKVGTAGYRKLIATGGTPSGWVAYEAARPETGTPTFTEVVPAAGELYANPAASQQMLDPPDHRPGPVLPQQRHFARALQRIRERAPAHDIPTLVRTVEHRRVPRKPH